ncbi:MAG: calcium-binding protein [Methylococcaceae bacterium]
MTIFIGNNDTENLTGSTGDDQINGNGGNDILIGDSGNDTLNGGLGNDSMQGNAGADTYLIAKADNQDIIYNWDADNSVDTVKFTNLPSTGITAVFGLNNDLVLQYGSGGQLTINNYFYTDANYRIDKFQFTDKEWTLAQLASQHKGTVNADSLIGFNGVVNIITALDGNDSLYGGDQNDTLNGGDGNDAFYSYAGNDQLMGGNGDDGMQAGDGMDTLDGGDGNDVLWAGEGFDTISGGTGNDTLEGDGGDDVLTGGLGNDSMQGNAGADTYLIAKADNQDIIYNWDADSSVDTVRLTDVTRLDLTGISSAPSDINSLVLSYGNGSVGSQITVNYYFYDVNYRINEVQLMGNDSLQNFIVGTVANDTLIGTDGSDAISGQAGVDVTNGGLGNDLYFVDNTTDSVIENSRSGIDTVLTSANYTLTNNVENLALLAGASNGTGNGMDNQLTGNSASNTLRGLAGDDVLDGGLKGDQLEGGEGNDTYLVDNIADTLLENENQGLDKVQSSVSFTLAANVENLLLTKDATINGTGNALNNELIGNTAVNILDGGAGNDVLDGAAGADVLKGGAGDDTYLVDAIDTVLENIGAGTDTVKASLSFNLNDNLENLILMGDAAINATGNDLANSLIGNSANNILNGGSGADVLQGKAGNDTYFVDNANDRVEENSGEGTDTVQSTIDYTLTSNVENLVLIGSAVKGTGDARVNSLTGNAGDNILDGGADADRLAGGAGNDTYLVDNIGDQVIEETNSGIDTLQTAMSYTLANNIENLTLTGTAALKGNGNDLANVLIGNSGNNILDGGKESDTMKGGEGDDTYLVNVTTDVVEENTNQGIDTISSSATYALSDNLENLILTGSAAIDATGNALVNNLTGNSANNILNGGSSADVMQGKAGDDTYFVDDTGDRIEENSGEGIDTVQSTINYTLTTHLEKLVLIGAAVNGTGNDRANSLVGNTGDNVLDGGADADSLAGGAGNDTYLIDNLSDQIAEDSNAGIDSVQSAVNYTLADNLENLTLTGKANLKGTGNDLANNLLGNSGNNILNGGKESDTMKGGEGDDTYSVNVTTDIVEEKADQGVDTVSSTATYALSDNVENLILTGSTAIDATGNALGNNLTGNSANNLLNGGIGADVMQGQAGDDTYFVDDAGDRIEENSGEGIDTVQSSINYTLPTNLEKLVLIGAVVNGTGNDRANSLVGNASDNVLDGGADADSLAGGAGNDSYLVDNSGDKLIEDSNGGIDNVQSSANYTLADHVENLTLTGKGSLKGTGNDLANILLGNSGNNILNGGKESDTMKAGEGNDTYLVDVATDVVVENANQGSDTVSSTVTYTLSDNVENLLLTGSSVADGIGNVLNNTLTGNAGANRLDGAVGADTLTGGSGVDVFVFNTLVGGTDTTLDVLSGVDKVQIGGDINIGNGDATIDAGIVIDQPNGFSAQAELVISNSKINGFIDRAAAATAIGSANSAFSIGDTRLLVVNNNVDSVIYQFTSVDTNAEVNASELTLIGTLQGTAQTVLADYLFA